MKKCVISLIMVLVLATIYIVGHRTPWEEQTHVLMDKKEKSMGSAEAGPIDAEKTEQFTNRICIDLEKNSKTTLIAHVQAHMIDPLFGVAFDIHFPDSLDFIRFEHGEFLEKGGSPLYLVQTSEAGKSLTTGISLKYGDLVQTGSGTLISFYFKHGTPLPPSFSFEHTVASNLIQGTRRDLANIQWQMCPSTP